MSPSLGIKAVVPASKKRKGASSSSGPTAEVRHPFLRFPIGPQEELFQILWAQPLIAGRCINWAAVEQVQLAEAVWALLTTDPWELFFGIIEPTYLEITMELYSTFYFQTVMTNYDDPGTEFKEENNLQALNRHIHRSPLRCWDALVPESTGIANTHDAYFLWCMSHGHVIDLAYFITLAIQHQTEKHRKGVISIGPYGISNILTMRMIEKYRGTYPLQYRLTQSTEEEAYEDIPGDVPPQHEDPPTQPPPPSRPIHAAASYVDISERLTRFEQQYFQRFDNIDATLQQICQHLHISSPVPPREPSSDEDV
ncbi:hypothetical protein GOBAR_AA26492 [Gossypium barbadense]|uniref:Uncharacterized protein n=1 Tax=Gossypium barbadense TaxID=3634 RepID=A0A2P5WSY6_GOSBA|nr:hypothetical protein GOBAR_AA26492 [Gossypium barbadense]